jgi:hypothetical protein
MAHFWHPCQSDDNCIASQKSATSVTWLIVSDLVGNTNGNKVVFVTVLLDFLALQTSNQKSPTTDGMDFTDERCRMLFTIPL